jgi:hypothetical protein
VPEPLDQHPSAPGPHTSRNPGRARHPREHRDWLALVSLPAQHWKAVEVMEEASLHVREEVKEVAVHPLGLLALVLPRQDQRAEQQALPPIAREGSSAERTPQLKSSQPSTSQPRAFSSAWPVSLPREVLTSWR